MVVSFPVEVKSDKSERLRSLHLLMDSFPNLKKAFVLSENKIIGLF
jgi:hypothetical protein